MSAQIIPTPGVMDQLKEATTELHGIAESHDFQRAFVKGTLTREQYGAYLGQLLHVHERVERHLATLGVSRPELSGVIRADHSSRLREDLKFLGLHPESIAPAPPTATLLSAIDRAASGDHLAALGFHYVLEGSMNGNRFIAMGMMRGMGLTPGPGLRYLDPYGERQRAVWAEFKDSMNAAGFSQHEIDTLVGAACDMFRGISSISQAMPLS